MLLYIYTSVYIKHKLFLFGLDREKRPHYVFVHEHQTYCYIMTKKSPDEWDALCPIKDRGEKVGICPGTAPQTIKRGQDGEAQIIKTVLSSINIDVGSIKVKRMHRMDSYTKDPVPHYVVPFASFEDMHKARNPLIKEGFNISELPHEKGKFFSDKEMLTCQWVEIDDEHIKPCSVSHGESKRRPVEIAVSSEHIKKANPTVRLSETSEERVPLNPPPAKMCGLDIEALSTRCQENGSRAHPDPSISGDIIYAMSLVFHDTDCVDIKNGTARGIKKYCLFVIPSNIHRTADEMDTKNDMISATWDKTDPQEPIEGEPFELEDTEMVFVNTEEELLTRFSEIMREEDPDVLYGYNVFGFDYDYISKRSKLYQIETYSRLIGFENEFGSLELSPLEQYESRSWEGAGHSWHSFTAPYCYGRICFDTFNNVKHHKVDKSNPKALQSHKLGDVGAYFVGHTKNDVVFKINGVVYGGHNNLKGDSYVATYLGYKTGNAALLKVIAEYCVQDTVVTMLVMDRLKGWDSARESAIIFCQDINDVTRSGQTKKIKDRVLRLAESLDYAFHPTERNVKMKLEGGFVQNPVIGSHDNVGCVDFSGMYPSVYMAYNICMSTFKKVLSPKDNPADWFKVRVPIQLGRIDLPAEMADFTGPDGEAFDVNLIDNAEYMKDLFEHNHFNPTYMSEFVQSIKEEYGLAEPRLSYYEMFFLKAHVKKGIFPVLLEEYKNARKEYKQLMKKSTDPLLKEIYDQKQNAVKIAMNSVYGVAGSYRGIFSFLEGSAAITYLGRSAVKDVAKSFEDDGCRIIYGDTDSVMVQSPGYMNQGLTASLHQESYEYFEKKTKWINDVLLADRKPMEIELEKIMNAVFITKKRYGGKTIWPKVEPIMRGLSPVRGDMFPYGKLIYTTVFSMILNDANKEEVMLKFSELIEQLETGQVPNDMIAVSKMLAHTYALASAPMNVFAKYLHSIGEVAEPGTKIPLVVTRPAGQTKGKQRAHYFRLPTTEEPIDYLYYSEFITKHIMQLVNAAFPTE